jgi:hypothetical protein
MAIEDLLNDLQGQISELKYVLDGVRKFETGGVWKGFTPTVSGFSSTTYAYIKYCTVGRICHVYLRLDGTSNSVSFGCNVPIPTANFGFTLYISSALAIDNTVQVNSASTFILPSSTSNIIFGKGVTTVGTTWTASGRKFITGLFSYQF